jgi:ribosomal protein S18 acetylase RimI-like enzyme
LSEDVSAVRAQGRVTVRSLKVPDDLVQIQSLDISFATDAICDVKRESRGFSIVERPVNPPLRKNYSVDSRELESASAAMVAEIGDAIVGVASVKYEVWNRRAVVSHLYVDAAARGRGVGSRLLQELRSRARGLGARTLFVETQNVNLPAVRFYERCGFTLVGLDTSLYDAEAASGESAIYLAVPLDGQRD